MQKTMYKTWAFAAASMLALGVSTHALAQDSIKIGFSGPLSGGAALYGKNCLAGLEFAASEINSKGGVTIGGKNLKVEIIPLDDRYAPSETAVNAKRLVQQYKTSVVFTPHSGGASALQAINVQDNFLLAGYTSVPSLTERGNPLTLRIPPSFASYFEPFAKYEIKKYGPKLAVAGGDHDYAKAWTSLFVPVWEKSGGNIVASNPMSYNKDSDFYSGVSKVLAASPNVLFIGGASEPTALVAKQARELGFTGGFVVMDQAKFDEMAKAIGSMELLEGSIGTLPSAADDRASLQAFIKRFKAARGADTIPGTETSFHYSSLYAILEAMKLAGKSDDPKAIRANMDQAVKTMPKENNPNDISAVQDNGGFVSPLVMGVVEGGKIVPYRPATN